MYEEYKISTTSPEIKVAPNSFPCYIAQTKFKNEYMLVIDYLKTTYSKSKRENFETLLNLGKKCYY